MDPSAERVTHLLDELDERRHGRADEATAELITAGAVIVQPLLNRVEGMGRLGHLCAIEIFEALEASEAIPALTALLESEDETVRGWAARALGGLGGRKAAPRLKELLSESRRRGTPPDWTEPVAIRRALAELGAREVVIPPDFAARLVEDSQLSPAVGDGWLEQALSALRDAEQVVLYFQRWRPWSDNWTWVDGQSWEMDWTSPWSALVEESHSHASEAARSRTHDESAVVTIEWMAEDDWPRN